MRRSAITISITLLCLIIVALTGGAGTVAADGCAYPVTTTDATGETVRVTDEPERVVALGGSAAQTLWEVGARDKVVGLSQFATYLDGASDLTVVTQGSSSTVQVETVVSLNPDLVIAANIFTNETVERIRQANITVYRADAATSIEDVYAKTRQIGRMAGTCDGANETVAWMQEEIGVVHEAVQGADEPRVLYPMGMGYAAGPTTFIGGMIDAAGGYNVVAEANTSELYPQLSAELAVEYDPQWLIATYPPGSASDDPRSLVPDGQALRNTTAWNENQIVVLNSNNLSQPAPRIVYSIRTMARAFHPDAYAAAAATATPSPTTTASPTPTQVETTSANGADSSPTATETGGQPGFGVAAVLVAITLVAIDLRRRQGV